jgi:hypothetical protein
MRQTISNGDPDPRCPGQTGALFRLRQPVDLVHVLNTMEGLLLLVPQRTPRSSGYDVYAHVVYVVICYMSITCICLLYVVRSFMSVIGAVLFPEHILKTCPVVGERRAEFHQPPRTKGVEGSNETTQGMSETGMCGRIDQRGLEQHWELGGPGWGRHSSVW